MATITLKNVPEELYERLKEAAERRGHSIEDKALRLLEISIRRE